MWKCIHTSPDFLVFGIGFLISGHGFIDCSVNEGGSAFTHALSVFLNDGSLLRGDADLYLDKSIIIFFIRSLTSFSEEAEKEVLPDGAG